MGGLVGWWGGGDVGRGEGGKGESEVPPPLQELLITAVVYRWHRSAPVNGIGAMHRGQQRDPRLDPPIYICAVQCSAYAYLHIPRRQRV